MATGGLYGSSTSGVVAAASGSESTGLYGNNTNFGGSYFEWFIFQVADIQPATPTGGSWSFTTNTGTPPAGWLTAPPANPTNTVWVSIALVNSKTASTLTWSVPGKFSYASGLPILSGNGTPSPTFGQSDQLYIELDITPQTIWFKTAGTWTRLTGSSLYVDLTSNQTIGGTKTFSNQIQGSVSGTSANVTGVVGISNGGTGSTTSAGARTALGAASSGANSDITSLSGLTTPLSVGQGGTGAITASDARINLGAAASGTNADITSMSGITGTLNSPVAIQMGNGNGQALVAGKIWYTPNTGAWNAGMGGGNITQQIGEELFVYGKASAAINDSPLQIVYQTGTVGSSGVISFGPTVAGITDGGLIIGVATEILALNGFGRVTSFGVIHGITTNGTAYGETWADGDTIWYNPVTGNPTKNKPTAPNIKVSVGTIIKAGNGGSGSFQVEINHGSVLGGTDSNVEITGTPTDKSLLQYDSAVNYWKNVSLASTAVTTFSGGTTGLTPATATTGAITLAGTLAVANGGTGVTTSTGSGSVVLATSPTLVTPALGTPSSGNFSTGTFTWPTFNQNTTGNAATATTSTNVSGGTASVTTLTTSSTVTLNGGTANAVPYLNGSKVLTSGSALTFDGTNLGVAGDIQQSNAAYLKGKTSAGTTTRLFGVNGANTLYIGAIDAAIGDMLFVNGGSEQMRLTSTGLGIGTSSPAEKLDVAGNITSTLASSVGKIVLRNSSTTSAELHVRPNSGKNGWLSFTEDAIADRWIVGVKTGNGSLFFNTGSVSSNTDRMVLDSSGNLGLGVTPSAWDSVFKSFDGGGSGCFGSLFFQANGDYTTALGSNLYYNGGWKYKATAAAGKYELKNNTHAWYTAPAGAAGNAITFTQAMTLDANGALTVGNITPFFATANRGNVSIHGSSSAILALATGGTGRGYIYTQGTDIIASAETGAYTVQTATAQPVILSTNNTERARIDSSGNLLVGTTSSATYGNGVKLSGSADAYASLGHSSGTTSGSGYVLFGYNGTGIGSITQNGTTGVLYNMVSDHRLKTVLGSITDSGTRIDALEPIEYEWKSDGSRTRGFLAHKFQEVYAGSVTGTKDAVDKDGKPVYQAMQAGSSEVIADLVAEIQSLRKRLAAAGI